MHSRIYEISAEPIAEDGRMSLDDCLVPGFIHCIIDDVIDITSRKDELDVLKDSLHRFGIKVDDKNETLTILPGGKEIYFRRQYTDFRITLEKALSASLSDFSNGIGLTAFNLRNTYEDEYGYYVWFNGESLITFDEFVRCSRESEIFHIGGIFDYHC
jgi:hypothetical protein